MMALMPSRPENYISLIRSGEVRIENVTNQLLTILESLSINGLHSDFELVLKAPDEQSLSRLLSQLRDLQVVFSGGSGWPPAEVFADLRERGLVSGEFREIIWRGPGQWFTRTR